MSEEWRDISGYEGFYQVSSAGRVRSLVRVLPAAFLAGVRKEKRILTVGYAADGRHCVSLLSGGKPRRFLVDGLVRDAFGYGADSKHGALVRGNAKLTDAQVLAIRADRRSSRIIAAEYGVSQVSVVFIKNRKTWKHLP